ncbi:MAG: hypothetical protein QXO70_01105, partial [Candidatus Pacearchaeota archaeon]
MRLYCLIFSAIFLCVICLFAQGDFGIPSVIPKQLLNACNSAPPALGQVIFNFDVFDTANPSHGHPVLPITYNRIFISTDNQASWTNYEPVLMGTIGYENTYYYGYDLPLSSGTFYYYCQIATDSTVTSQAPKNFSETFPPPLNLLANIHDDPANDDLPIVLYSTYNWENTDLRNFKLGYSDNKMFVQMTTNGGFATSHTNLKQLECGILPDKYVDVYHLYAAPIINPEAPYNDSIFYAVIYGNMNVTFLVIGIVITPGVYKIVKPGPSASITDYLNAYTKISTDGVNFNYSISGNTLDMCFTISLLTSDPDFGP